MENRHTLEIYPSKVTYLERSELRLGQSNISSRNKELIEEYQLYLIGTGKTHRLRQAKLINQSVKICQWLKDLQLSDLDKLTKKEALRLIVHINKNTAFKEATRADYRRCLKQFYKWFKEDDKRLSSLDYEQREETRKFYHFLEKEVSSDSKIVQADPETIISDADCLLVVEKGCRMPKERAFISLLHETGCRAAEFLNLRISDLKQKDNLLEIHVPDGKTGKRVIYATKSIRYVLNYLEVHPDKDNKDSFLWISENSTKKGQSLIHIGGQKLINRCFTRANIKKKHNWHWFRHSRATILAPKLTEVMLCKYMGWVPGSRQIKRYVHLCNEQLENVYLSIHGMQQTQEISDKPIKCICGTLNQSKERYCYRCYKPLRVDVAIQDADQDLKVMTEQTIETMRFFMELTKNPELMKKFEEFKNRDNNR
jgi:site-specific recombinase XerD